MTSIRVLVVIAIASIAGAAAAQSMKPGLWEIRQSMRDGSGQMDKAMADMQKQLASMPPEQRKMVEQSMAGRMGAMGGSGTTTQSCITRDMADRNNVPMQRADCSSTPLPRSGNTMKFAFSCTNPPSKGEGEITFTGNESYTMRMNVTSSAAGGPQSMAIEQNARWLSADCGNVKALPPPR
jgi:hypothetical protein